MTFEGHIVRASDLRVGDTIIAGGTLQTITSIEDYGHDHAFRYVTDLDHAFYWTGWEGVVRT